MESNDGAEGERPWVLALSGKRFAGKDTLAGLLVARAEARQTPLWRVALADESKRAFVEDEAAQGREVVLARMLDDRLYKESMRPRLSRFTGEALARDPQVFCRRALGAVPEGYAALLLTDLRLRSDAAFLRSRCRAFVVRVRCDDATRARLGWRYNEGVDAHWAETDLDAHNDWDLIVDNPGDLVRYGHVADAILDAFIRFRSA